jgi:argininosuccinate synthase
MSKSVTGSAALVMASRLALPKKGNVSLLNAAMKARTKACNQDDATGFIRLNALRLKVAAKVQKK